ncbi:PspA/IM30 family protein [Roseibium suaedae]|uniref:Phage shock protein A (PspA) family protein n=1 Tax=Roseibium suaedae TaxID=735517 RepID=A0A1M7GZM0_9HYPH|nr:PspA/IM30 family protein [Roseibium suaedae]SHM21329.1 phage shock protein A (PspA) family protein [Roseibium suaedae]
MAENISGRVSRLISGTAHSLVTAVENMAPEMVMEEAIREVDRAIDDVRAELGKVLSKAHMANTRLADENRKHDELSEKIRIALAEGREDLAETAVARLLDIEAQVPLLESTIAETREAQAEFEGFIKALQGRKREMNEDLQEFRAQKASQSIAGKDEAAASPNGLSASVERAEDAFNRAMTQAGGIANQSTFQSQKADAAKLAELDELARNNRIKERLAAFQTKD